MCFLDFSWRKKWEKVWEAKRFCSEKCLRQKRSKLRSFVRENLDVFLDQSDEKIFSTKKIIDSFSSKIVCNEYFYFHLNSYVRELIYKNKVNVKNNLKKTKSVSNIFFTIS